MNTSTTISDMEEDLSEMAVFQQASKDLQASVLSTEEELLEVESKSEKAEGGAIVEKASSVGGASTAVVQDSVDDYDSDESGEDWTTKEVYEAIQKFVEDRLAKAVAGEAYKEHYDDDSLPKLTPDPSALRRARSTPSIYSDNETLEDKMAERQSEKYRSHPTLSLSRKQSSSFVDSSLPNITVHSPSPERSNHTTSRERVKLPKIDDESDLEIDISEDDDGGIEGISWNERHNNFGKPSRSFMSKYGEVASIAEDEVKHNWILQDEAKLRQRRVDNRTSRFLLSVPDEDPLVAIESRMDEVRRMSKPRRDERYVLDRIDPEQKEKILVSFNPFIQSS